MSVRNHNYKGLTVDTRLEVWKMWRDNLIHTQYEIRLIHYDLSFGVKHGKGRTKMCRDMKLTLFNSLSVPLIVVSGKMTIKIR